MKSNATLVKIIPRGELASLVTCRKDGGKSPTFLFFRERMLQWLQESSGARYYESDMYSYLSAYGGETAGKSISPSPCCPPPAPKTACGAISAVFSFPVPGF